MGQVSSERSFFRNDEVIRQFILFWQLATIISFALMLRNNEVPP